MASDNRHPSVDVHAERQLAVLKIWQRFHKLWGSFEVWFDSKRKDFMSEVVGDRVRVKPMTGWFLLALLVLVGYLTYIFAPGAAERALQPHGVDPQGVITVQAGLLTVFVIALLAVATGLQSRLAHWWDSRKDSGTWLWLGRPDARPWTVAAVLGICGYLWRLPSVVFSSLDYLFARVLSWFAGAQARTPSIRYRVGLVLVLFSAVLGLWLPPPYGLGIVGIAIVLTLAVVRRWSWLEAERETSRIERGMGKDAERDDFKEDLRLEAMLALACLFLLMIPLGLRQVYLASCALGTEHCAFMLHGPKPDSPLAQYWSWLGYFGAELAKAVPFVDWSEVFHVANASPIEPKSDLGKVVVFGMRAALDLLLLAAILQAVQIARRLRDQEIAFDAGRLSRLEPLTEKRKLGRLEIDPALHIHPAAQPSIATFPTYDEERLRALVGRRETNEDVRKAAAALLQRQHLGQGPAATEKLFTDLCETASEVGPWIYEVAGCVGYDLDLSSRDHLEELVKDPGKEIAVRAAAARALGRMGLDDAGTEVLLTIADGDEDLTLRADAAVALAKAATGPQSALDQQSVQDAIQELVDAFTKKLEIAFKQAPDDFFNTPPSTEELKKFAECFEISSRPEEALIPVLSTAYAWARYAPSEKPENIASKFHSAVHQHALRAARIQSQPMKVEEATKTEISNDFWDQMIRIEPGKGVFELTFRMGRDLDRNSDSSNPQDHTDPYEHPRCKMKMNKRPFAIGRYPVTREEYDGFCSATGRIWLDDDEDAESRWPAGFVTWSDAIAYCDWLSRVTGELYRLPSEAEWEYCCRAGSPYDYSWGPNWDLKKAATNLENRVDVGSHPANKWGLFDMHGNVWEWCADPWHADHTDRPSDGQVWLKDGKFHWHAARGGSFYEEGKRWLRSSFRDRYVNDYRDLIVGFRIARTLSPKLVLKTSSA